MLKIKKIILILCGILLFFFIACLLYIFIPRKDLLIAIDSSVVIPYLKDGDIILRKSNAGWSDIFNRFSLTDKRFSHLGIIRIHNGNISVINSVGNISISEESVPSKLKNRKPEVTELSGVHEISLNNFLKVAINIGIFRSRFIDGSLISEKAAGLIGIPFDWDFDIDDDSKIYCTELLYAVINSIAPEHNIETRYLDILGRDIIPLDSISAACAFEEILYIELPGKN